MLDRHRYVAHPPAEFGRQPVQRLGDHLFETVGLDLDHQPIVHRGTRPGARAFRRPACGVTGLCWRWMSTSLTRNNVTASGRAMVSRSFSPMGTGVTRTCGDWWRSRYSSQAAADPEVTGLEIAMPLSTSGRFIVDAHDRRVRLAGVNWYGFHEDLGVAPGLDRTDRQALARRIAGLGFDSVRLPFSLWMTGQTAPVADQYLAANPDLAGATPMEVYDACVQALHLRGSHRHPELPHPGSRMVLRGRRRKRPVVQPPLAGQHVLRGLAGHRGAVQATRSWPPWTS